ncbi:MAG: hypothetical protein EA353_11915 [Puniceicoccaceae bacterium]|nr:MAG: hypothetical protein EA353_11915 [Puniceicoccaceae bacterium]
MQILRTSRILAASLLFGVLALSGAARAEVPAPVEVPAFVAGSLFSPNAAFIAEVMPTLAADVVILSGGLEQGLRRGMVCRVTRGPMEIGELIIIESRSDRAAGLILELVEDFTIQSGDVARIKTLQNS